MFSIDMGANDGTGQTPEELYNAFDNIFKVVCGINVHKINKCWLGTYDPTKIQPIPGRLFLLSLYIIPCQKIIRIKKSVRDQDDIFRIQ